MTGEELCALRRGLGMTQAGFATALGISVSQLHNYEAGRERHSGEPIAVPRLVMLAARWLEHELPPAEPPRPGRPPASVPDAALPRLSRPDRDLLGRIARGWRPLKAQLPQGDRLARRGLLRLDWGPKNTPDADRMVWRLTDLARELVGAPAAPSMEPAP